MNKSFLALAIICASMMPVSISAAEHVAAVVSPRVPAKVTFADQTYSFNRIDMYERLDRELVAMSYAHSNTILMIKRANRLFPELVPILKRNGVPVDLVYLACIESSLNQRAYSGAKAAGLWQFMPSTARQYGLEVNDYVDERYNLEKATEAACKYLKDAHSKYGNWESAAAAYNAGSGRISKELDSQMAQSAMDLYLVDETSRYMFRLLAAKLIMEHPSEYGIYLTADQLYTPMSYDVVEVSTSVDDWPTWAKQHDITFYQLKEANLWIRDKSLPNKTGKTYKVRIPRKDSLYRSTADKTVYYSKWIHH
jgi:hypothetical protein